MLWASVAKFGRSPLIFVKQGVKLNQKNYRNNILVGSLLPWTKEHFLRHFNKIWYRCTELKRRRSGYQPMFPTLFPKRNGPLHHPIWILSILISGDTSRARSQQQIIKVWRHWRQKYERNGRKCPRTWFVTLAGHFRGVFCL